MCLAIPMKVVEIEGERATVELEGIRRVIGLALLEGVEIGDHLLIHAGFAIQRLDEEAALETLEIFRQLKNAL
ncbi:MAG TPA: HypC/HybG/HupF family hydrogenase formation chaperone [Cyanobacteria bacterium UBA8530]|nr:HypC/HybG/HupF family hydrogenase formation chaperone [Cyanobacteria bacterium UBA8530]